MRYVLTLVFALWTAGAQAASLWVTPPRKYVHKFPGRVIVLANYTPSAVGAFWPVYGYTFVLPTKPKTCVIQVWRPYYGQSLWEHELSHCNGWPAWHPST